MRLRLDLPEADLPVQIDNNRTQQALSSVLLVAHAVSRAPDTVELVVSPAATGVRVVVRNLNSQVGAVTSEARLGMAIAEASIRSPRGAFSWSLMPFNVQIELPTVHLAHP